METRPKTKVAVNLIDFNNDGKIDMISFVNQQGSVGLAIDRDGSGTMDQIYIFQDVTGDGVLDEDDEIFLRDKSDELMKKYAHDAPQQIIIEF